MADLQFYSYSLKGVKESFANWVSIQSPEDTPFSSMTGKEAIRNTKHQWQTDVLAPAAENANLEGAAAADVESAYTQVIDNSTQILNKVVKVSDTANAVDSWGRGQGELAYQMEKKAKELKRDIEYALLRNGPAVTATGSVKGKLGGFQALVGTTGATHEVNKSGHTGTQADPDTGAVVTVTATGGASGSFGEDDLFGLTQALYTAGAKPSVIMINPKHASTISALMEKSGVAGGVRQRSFDGAATTLNVHVGEIIYPLGQVLKVVPNRLMPTDAIYVFNPEDWTQMVLREPARKQLAKDGDAEKWAIYAELTLRHRNPYASGVLKTKA